MAQNNNKNIGHLLAAKIIIIFHSPLKINAVKINEAAAFRRRSLRSRVASLLSYYFIYAAIFLLFLRLPKNKGGNKWRRQIKAEKKSAAKRNSPMKINAALFKYSAAY